MADKEKAQKHNGYVKTTTEVYDSDGHLTETHVETAPRGFSSVEIAVDSKGNIKPSVKVYHEDPRSALKEAKSIMEDVMDWSVKHSQE